MQRLTYLVWAQPPHRSRPAVLRCGHSRDTDRAQSRREYPSLPPAATPGPHPASSLTPGHHGLPPISIALSSREWDPAAVSRDCLPHSAQVLEMHGYFTPILCYMGLRGGWTTAHLPTHRQEPWLYPVGGCSKHLFIAFCVNAVFHFSG